MSRDDARDSTIPILLLKTKSHPVDAYEELFCYSDDFVLGEEDEKRPSLRFNPIFVPVLEHSRVEAAVLDLEQKLEDGLLKHQYGGIIFTSQRAVEAWADVVHHVIRKRINLKSDNDGPSNVLHTVNQDPFSTLEDLTVFPFYVVGPATARILQALIDEYYASDRPRLEVLPFTRLMPIIHGADTGNGANLAAFILEHYNNLYAEHWFNYFEGPRLPFVPLLGMSSENYGRKRLDEHDPRLRKKPLLFLVGETRRDIIPKTLQKQNDKLKIDVEEMEVYKTEVMSDFDQKFRDTMTTVSKSNATIAVVVVFSPQGSETMLKGIGYLNSDGQSSAQARARTWKQGIETPHQIKWIIVTIGPTTRDFLKKSFGIESDVCAEKPNPESLKQGIEEFLQKNELYD